MIKKFNLSNEIIEVYGEDNPDNWKIEVQDIKEFIKRDSELILDYKMQRITWEELCEKRNKLAGPKLIKK